MLLNLLRLILGSVCFTVSGKYPERFINITARNSVRLWNVRKTDDGFCACMYRRDYRGIRTLARRAGVRLRVTQKRGLPEFLHRYRNRAGVLLGACAFLCSVFVMSLFIWSIDITGLSTLSRCEVQMLLRDNGVYIGAFKPAIDPQQVARDIMVQRHEIGWMAVNLSGSYASVEIKEEAPAPEVPDISTPCNIKASADGVIVRIEAAEGEIAVKEGSGVIEGQLLVSGVRGSEESAYRLVHADARVYARTTRQASFSVEETSSVLRPTGEEAERKCLSLFGMLIPYHFASVKTPYSVSDTYTVSPAPLDRTLPIGVATERVYAMESIERCYDENSAEEILKREAAVYEVFNLSDCKVETREYHLSRHNGVYTLSVDYTCIEDIAFADPIGVE